MTEDSQVVSIELPNGSTEKIAVRDKRNAAVRDLKVTCELQFGIPCNLQQVSALKNPNQEFNDWMPLTEAMQVMGNDAVFVVRVPVWWNKFICVCLNNEIENVCIRAKLPMQQISKEERLFVGCYIACCCGNEKLLERLQTMDIQCDHQTTTRAGRNLFHAAAASGKVNCVEFVAKHLIKPSKENLTLIDTNRETPIDIARRLNHSETERLLYKYMYNKKGERMERNSTESGIDLSEESESEDSAEEKSRSRANISAREEQGDGDSKSAAVIKPICLKDEELVITDCDEGLSFAVDTKSKQVTPPNSHVEANQQDGLTNRERSPQRRHSPCSSESSDESSNISPRLSRPQTLNVQSNQHLLQRRFKETDPYRPKSARTVRCPRIYLEEEEEASTTDNHLPPLEGQTQKTHAVGNVLSSSASNLQIRRMKQALVRTNSGPNSPASNRRLSPTEESATDDFVSKSAPGSPQSPRFLFKPSGGISPASPKVSRALLDRRRGSEPVAAMNKINGIRFPRTRRDATITADLHGDIKGQPASPIMFRRGKARSICEVSLSDSLKDLRCYKDMDEEERLDRPWNAWIAVRKESLQVVNPEPILDSRKKSFQQWLSEKELAHLRGLFANAQEAAKTNEKQAKMLKGKSFEEWLEDKQREYEREKEKEKGLEDQQKQQEDKKHQRRRMSQAKYDKWLLQKERDALLMEEKREQMAKQKHELLKKKWEEEDEMKKNCKQTLGRTQSLPVEDRAFPTRQAINKHRVTSLK